MKHSALILLSLVCVGGLNAQSPVKAASAALCRTEILEGQVNAGHGYRKPISPQLDLLLQPVHSGWILRVVPHSMNAAELGNPALLDYAELATPPYQSITPLSVSTDFAFRAQDAVGWNPRRFRFASTQVVYQALRDGYQRFMTEKGPARGQRERELAALVAQSPEGLFTILDARLVPGAADQWAGAAAVSAAFTETAHTLVLPAEGKATPLGSILELRFRVELSLPAGFSVPQGAVTKAHVCAMQRQPAQVPVHL